MHLEDIQDPQFLKEMNLKELNDLAGDIRHFLIQNISRTGGHLASNLGAVELTIALHYVFNTPHDKVFFDVGHQSYVHKILTGRAQDFPTLRQFNGLSGFQKRSESIHDVWEAGHSSTSLSAALGMAVARDLNHDSYCIVPVIGDGALSSGIAMEALNQIGSEKRNMVIVFNDNNMSISRNVGGMNEGLSKLRSSKGYTSLKRGMKKGLRSNNVGEAVYSGLKSFKDAIRDAVINGGIFEELNLDYIGPVDGHNIRDMIQIFEAVRDHDGPIVVHVLTEKGRGYIPCEHDTEGIWHSVGPFDVHTGKQITDMPKGYKNWGDIFADALDELAENDRDICVLTPAMKYGSCLQRFFAKYPERSFDCGIAEEHAAVLASGMAIAGKKPFLCMYSSFLQRAYDEINHDICRMDLPVMIGIDHAGLVGADGETHHGVFDIGILNPLPNLVIAQPKDASEARNLIYTGLMQKHPFAVRYPKGRTKASDKPFEEIRIGTWEAYNDSEDNRIAVFTYGEYVDQIAEKAEVNHLPVTVINCRFIKPLDYEMIRHFAKRNMTLISYESDMLKGGLSDMILGWCNDNDLSVKLIRFGIPELYVRQGSNLQLRRELGIDLGSLMEEIQKHLHD